MGRARTVYLLLVSAGIFGCDVIIMCIWVNRGKVKSNVQAPDSQMLVIRYNLVLSIGIKHWSGRVLPAALWYKKVTWWIKQWTKLEIRMRMGYIHSLRRNEILIATSPTTFMVSKNIRVLFRNWTVYLFVLCLHLVKVSSWLTWLLNPFIPSRRDLVSW